MEKTKKSQEGKKMKEVIEKALSEMCMNSRFAVNSESGRSHMAEHLLKTFEDNHIVFYTNLDAVREDPKMMNKIENKRMERGL